MASSKRKIGLQNVLMGDVANDGGAGTSLSPIGDTVQDSASMTTTDDTKTDFNTEESDSPILSIVSQPGKVTFNFSTYNNNVDNLIRIFGGTKTNGAAGNVKTLGTITPGSGYSDGVYYDVPLTGTGVTGVRGNVTVVGGLVTKVDILEGGAGATTSSSLTAVNTFLGGAGSGFAVAVTAVQTGPDAWNAPDTFAQKTQTVKLPWKLGGFLLIPAGLVSGKLNLSFKKTTLSQIDVTVDVLQPAKAGVPRMILGSDLP